jgi:hypothetical protein
VSSFRFISRDYETLTSLSFEEADDEVRGRVDAFSFDAAQAAKSFAYCCFPT